MNRRERRKELTEARDLLQRALSIVDDVLSYEPNADAISYLEQAADRLNEADEAVGEAISLVAPIARKKRKRQ